MVLPIKHALAAVLVVVLVTLTLPPAATASLVQADPYAKLWARIDGSTATIPLSEALAMRHAGVDALAAAGMVKHNTTPNAYNNLISGVADVIFVTAPAEEDLNLARAAGIELEVIPVVRDALVFLCNVRNPVTGLTQEQLRGIYTGKVTHWSEVGGLDLPISAYQRPVRSGSQTLFLQLLMKDLSPMDAPLHLQPGYMGELVDAVAGYENGLTAIGYTMFYYVNDMYGSENLRLLAVDGVAPDAASIAAGHYPLDTYYYAVLRKDTPPDSLARGLVEWLLTNEGQRVAQDAGYVPLRVLPAEEGSP